jgi:hypothetical protein
MILIIYIYILIILDLGSKLKFGLKNFKESERIVRKIKFEWNSDRNTKRINK